jgi:hypothetical protein
MRELGAAAGNGSLLSKWQESIVGIRADVITLSRDREIYRKFAEIASQDDELKENIFTRQVASWFVRSGVLAARRHTGNDTRATSLRALIEDMANSIDSLDYGALTESYVAEGFNKESAAMLAQRLWSRLPDNTGKDLSVEMLRADIDRLTATGRSLRRLGVRVLQGVIDESDGLVIPTELEDAVAVIDELSAKYCSTLTGSTNESVAALEPHRWEAIFQRAWVGSANSDWSPSYLPGDPDTPTDALPMTKEIERLQPQFMMSAESTPGQYRDGLTLTFKNVGKDSALNVRVFVPMYGPFGFSEPIRPGEANTIALPFILKEPLFGNLGGVVQLIVEYQDWNGGNRYRQYAKSWLYPVEGSIGVKVDPLEKSYRVRTGIIADPAYTLKSLPTSAR